MKTGKDLIAAIEKIGIEKFVGFLDDGGDMTLEIQIDDENQQIHFSSCGIEANQVTIMQRLTTIISDERCLAYELMLEDEEVSEIFLLDSAHPWCDDGTLYPKCLEGIVENPNAIMLWG